MCFFAPLLPPNMMTSSESLGWFEGRDRTESSELQEKTTATYHLSALGCHEDNACEDGSHGYKSNNGSHQTKEKRWGMGKSIMKNRCHRWEKRLLRKKRQQNSLERANRYRGSTRRGVSSMAVVLTELKWERRWKWRLGLYENSSGKGNIEVGRWLGLYFYGGCVRLLSWALKTSSVSK